MSTTVHPGLTEEIDWRPQPSPRQHHVFERTASQRPSAVALECDGLRLTYAELDRRANQLAHLLRRLGLNPGARAGIMVPRSVSMYVSLLAVQKAGATYVPIDPGAPADRVAFIAQDAGLDLLLVGEGGDQPITGLPEVLAVDSLGADLDGERDEPPLLEVEGDPISYICYTSGSSGKPKGVEIAQSSICTFLSVVPEIYGVQPNDRVYQGMTLSFDFSIEEIWPTWAVGATVVAGPSDARVGPALASFLEKAGITMIYCVPTVLATLDRTVDSIRTVNVGGEACPPELVQRWAPGRRLLNTYGPTETTVTCTWAELSPDQPVTIGRPLPTYVVDLLDDHLQQVPSGEVGEICVGGPGVARGYVNLPEKTAERFVFDPTRPGSRLYRTGDLGRYLPSGEIEYLGRADAEVKVRGHRVDLQEIESVLMEDGRVAAAVATLVESESGGELAAFVVPATHHELGDDLRTELDQRARRVLPHYMVPAFLEPLEDVPMLPSGKADRRRLPEPTGPRLVADQGNYVQPKTTTEARLAALWEDVLRLPTGSVSVEADVFTDLGAHSLVAATVASRLRTEDEHADVSIVDVYTFPTVRSLAAHMDQSSHAGADEHQPAPVRPARPAWWRVASFGLAQMTGLYAVLVLGLLPVAVMYAGADGIPSWDLVGRLLLTLPISYLLVRWVVPLVGVRLLSRGITAGDHPLWGAVHLRTWAVQKLLAISPLATLAGSPWAAPYLRLTGARVGEGCHIGTAQVPLPALVSLADGSTVGYATHLRAVEIVDGRLAVGRVDLDAEAVVEANCVVQGPCRVGAGSVLHAQSLLEPGMHVPDAERWAGSPARARPAEADGVLDLMVDCPLAQRSWPRPLLPWFAAGVAVLELLPLAVLAPLVGLVWWALLTVGEVAAVLATVASGPIFVLTVCATILGLRRFALPATPVGVHHLRSQLGMEKWFGDRLLELSLLLTNTLYSTLYTPLWLRALGARVERGAEVSTIGNIDPDLLELEEDCFVADMASVGSAVYANGHVALRATGVGSRAFVGNAAFVPSGTHLGEGSLVGVGSVPPPLGTAPGTSWLGSPPFFLPKRDVYEGFGETDTFRPSAARVRARYVIEFFRVVLPASILALSTFATLYGLSFVATQATWAVVLVTPLLALAASLLVVLLIAAIKWLVVGRYRPRVEPLWSSFVRGTEFVTGLYEGAAVPVLLGFLSGTPLLGPMLRLFGARVGRRSLMDTTYLTEFDLVRIGDDVHVGPAASLQTHLFEDRVMKMSTIDIGDGVTIGTRGVVLYDTDLEDGVRMAPLSLVMKGETLRANTVWHGLPAQAARRASQGLAADVTTKEVTH